MLEWGQPHRPQREVELPAVLLPRGTPGPPHPLCSGVSALAGSGCGTQMAAERLGPCFQTDAAPTAKFISTPPSTHLAGGDVSLVCKAGGRKFPPEEPPLEGQGQVTGLAQPGQDPATPFSGRPRHWTQAGLPEQAASTPCPWLRGERPGPVFWSGPGRGRAEDISGQSDPGRDRTPSPGPHSEPWYQTCHCPLPHQAAVAAAWKEKGADH